MSARPESGRSDWTDLDLLTRKEAGERLHAEIAETRARLDELGEADPQARAALEQRLSLLRARAGDLSGG
ncbi:hypothetical protein SAMN04489712_12222 [Thermomonospora echinospora]|uniref:Uncharacterized protein n=1 Tax=Thermomonospora echinospora TaxID=1992 RepID=A0A1H6DUU1_9ACTN|nr:hypothetical protein [Thermomonospora echinospora]SEG88523.1 hypothetical protein SAMN04489712_12222 [Thermomonospora echinospora]